MRGSHVLKGAIGQTDLWFELEVKPRLRGRATLIRHADDFIIAFEEEEDARRVMDVRVKRLRRLAPALHLDKSGQDAASSLPAPAGGTEERRGSGDLRLPRVHALLGALPEGSMGNALQDARCAPAAGRRIRR